jgi:hypothetical protein
LVETSATTLCDCRMSRWGILMHCDRCLPLPQADNCGSILLRSWRGPHAQGPCSVRRQSYADVARYCRCNSRGAMGTDDLGVEALYSPARLRLAPFSLIAWMSRGRVGVYGFSFDDGPASRTIPSRGLGQSAPTSRAIAKAPVRECARPDIRIAPVFVRSPTNVPNLAIPVRIA